MSDSTPSGAQDTPRRPSPTPRRPSPTPRAPSPADNGTAPPANSEAAPPRRLALGSTPVDAAVGLGEMVRGAPRVDAADAIGLARVAGTVVWRAVGAVTRRSIGAATEIARDVQSGEPVSDIVDHQVEKARSVAVQVLGLAGNPAVTGALPGPVARVQEAVTAPARQSGARGLTAADGRGITANDLRAIGNQMLRTSAYAGNQPQNGHPAFAAMLTALTPDEVRILRFLAVAGPQPSLDVRTKTPFGIGSERLAGGLNMIAEMSGCSYPDLDHHYLANLNRLGLVRFSVEPVVDFRRYSLVEAQPKVSQAMEKASRSATVYRSIYLSLFGQQFCEACFDLEGYDAGGWADYDRGDKIIGKGTPRPKKKHH